MVNFFFQKDTVDVEVCRELAAHHGTTFDDMHKLILVRLTYASDSETNDLTRFVISLCACLRRETKTNISDVPLLIRNCERRASGR